MLTGVDSCPIYKHDPRNIGRPDRDFQIIEQNQPRAVKLSKKRKFQNSHVKKMQQCTLDKVKAFTKTTKRFEWSKRIKGMGKHINDSFTLAWKKKLADLYVSEQQSFPDASAHYCNCFT